MVSSRTGGLAQTGHSRCAGTKLLPSISVSSTLGAKAVLALNCNQGPRHQLGSGCAFDFYPTIAAGNLVARNLLKPTNIGGQFGGYV